MTTDAGRAEAVDRYLDLTRRVLPEASQTRDWPVSEDHCFQRIILDTVCCGVWYEHLPRPAYLHLTADQARAAAKLAQDVLDGHADLWALNAQSLAWRKSARSLAKPDAQLTLFPCPDAPTSKTRT